VNYNNIKQYPWEATGRRGRGIIKRETTYNNNYICESYLRRGDYIEKY